MFLDFRIHFFIMKPDQNGNGGKKEYLEVSQSPHFLSLTMIKGDESSTDRYLINTHAFDGSGIAAYPTGGNSNEGIYNKKYTDGQSSKAACKFEKQCDENDICDEWKILAVNAQLSGTYMQAKANDENLHIKEIITGRR